MQQSRSPGIIRFRSARHARVTVLLRLQPWCHLSARCYIAYRSNHLYERDLAVRPRISRIKTWSVISM
jgi:hypothetical protein